MTLPLAHLRLAELFEAGHGALMAQYGARLHPRQHQAMAAIRNCRSGELGELCWRCPDCTAQRHTPRSCGHRSCPACQNHCTSQWLDRQRRKLLPVDYFMVTFTVPALLRPTAQAHPEAVYAALFRAAAETLQGFAAHKLNAEIGQCAVLHTHNRRLDLHPHVHIVVPGGGIDARRRQWRKLGGRYLFNAFALARVFRARLLQALHRAGVPIPAGMPPHWVVDCRRVGRGEPALQYLSRYLYRGVIRERDLLDYITLPAPSRSVTATRKPANLLCAPCPSPSSCGACSRTSCPTASVGSASTDSFTAGPGNASPSCNSCCVC